MTDIKLTKHGELSIDDSIVALEAAAQTLADLGLLQADGVETEDLLNGTHNVYINDEVLGRRFLGIVEVEEEVEE